MDDSYKFQTGPIKPTYTLQPVKPKPADLEENLNSHPLFMDSVPVDEKGKGYLKLFAALSEGLVPVDAEDRTSPQATSASVRFDTLEDHITEERASRLDRFAELLPQRQQELHYLDRLGPRSAPRTRKRRASDTDDPMPNDLTSPAVTAEYMTEQATVAVDVDTISQASRDGIDDASVASMLSVASEGATRAVKKRRRVENLRKHLQARREQDRAGRRYSDSDSSGDDDDRDIRSQISEMTREGDRMVLLATPGFPSNAMTPSMFRSSRSMYDERDMDANRVSRDDSALTEESIQADAAQRVEDAETRATLRFMNL